MICIGTPTGSKRAQVQSRVEEIDEKQREAGCEGVVMNHTYSFTLPKNRGLLTPKVSKFI